MKYIKTFESKKTLIPRRIQIEVGKILSQLEDLSFEWIDKPFTPPYINICKYVNGNFSNIDYDEIEETIIELKKYLNEVGYDIDCDMIKGNGINMCYRVMIIEIKNYKL